MENQPVAESVNFKGFSISRLLENIIENWQMKEIPLIVV